MSLSGVLIDIALGALGELGLDRLLAASGTSALQPHVCPRCKAPDATAHAKRRLLVYRCPACSHVWRRLKPRPRRTART